MKFKVGDIVTGIKDAPYIYTNEHMIGRVVKIKGTEGIDVEVLHHSTEPDIIGNIYHYLDSTSFKHYIPYNTIVKIIQSVSGVKGIEDFHGMFVSEESAKIYEEQYNFELHGYAKDPNYEEKISFIPVTPWETSENNGEIWKIPKELFSGIIFLDAQTGIIYNDIAKESGNETPKEIETPKEMTIKEIETELGYPIKIVKE